MKKFQARWKATAATVNGEDALPNNGKDAFLEFKGRKMLLTQNDKEMEFFEIEAADPSTTPKLLDLKAVADMGPITKDTIYEAIYKLDGDTLTIALYFR